MLAAIENKVDIQLLTWKYIHVFLLENRSHAEKEYG